jgi:hypothetical protein
MTRAVDSLTERHGVFGALELFADAAAGVTAAARLSAAEENGRTRREDGYNGNECMSARGTNNSLRAREAAVMVFVCNQLFFSETTAFGFVDETSLQDCGEQQSHLMFLMFLMFLCHLSTTES